MNKKKLNAHELYEAMNNIEIGMDGIILTKSEILYNEYIDSKNELVDEYIEKFSDNYTVAWDRIRECSGSDRDTYKDWIDFIEYRMGR